MKILGGMDLTLVAFYGPKPESLAELVRTLQTALCSHLGAAFSAYSIEQVHGTVVGLEGRRAGADVLNANLSQARGWPCSMDIAGFIRCLGTTPRLPLRIRVGGFKQTEGYPFTSRGLHPYVRSFALRGPIAVAMGWPIKGDLYPLSLDELRRECTEYGILHKYHEKMTDIDNDFFFVLGRVDRDSVPREKADSAEHALREMLSKHKPLDIGIGIPELSVVAYVDTQLPIASSAKYPIPMALAEVEELKSLYREKK
jgi:hypothetical protein